MFKTAWREHIKCEMEEHDESFSNVESMVPADGPWLDVKFSDGYSQEGVPFTLWTKARVYFPAVYDGRESCESVSRHYDGKVTFHVTVK